MRETIICLIALSLLAALPAAADWSHDPTENNPICVATGPQEFPAALSNEEGEIFIAWSDYRDGLPGQVFAQKISADGIPLWSTDGTVICSVAPAFYEIFIVSDGAGGAIFAWANNLDFGSDLTIHAQRMSADGQPQWAADGIPVGHAAGSHQYISDMVPDGDGGAIICWSDSRWNFDIFAQRVSAAGVELWGTGGLMVCVDPESQDNGRMVPDDSGGVIITWTDDRNPASENDIFAQRVNAMGQVQWAPDGVAVCTADNAQWHPRPFPDDEGGAIIAWWDKRSGGDYASIYAQRLSPTGLPLWAPNGLPAGTTVSDTSYQMDAMADGAGGIVLCWEDVRSNPDGDLYAQRLDGNGSPSWAEEGVLVQQDCTPDTDCTMVNDGSGGAIICWSEALQGIDRDLLGQRVGANGTLLWTPGGVAVGTAPEFQKDQVLVQGPGGSAVAVWADFRTISTDIYAQQVNTEGVLGGPVNQAPVAEAGGSPLVGYAPLIVQFQSTSWDPDGDPIDHAWDFGDPGSPNNTSNEVNPIHEFTDPGTHTVTLTVSDGLDEDSDPVTISVWQPLVGASLTCSPGAGTVPFTTVMTLSLENLNTGFTRRVSGHIDVFLASGTGFFPNWRAGFTNIDPGASYDASWPVNIPALGSLIGANRFELHAMDVTPPPYNIFPFPPSGSTDSDICVVYGIAP